MPTCFKFTDRKTRETIALQRIDILVCEEVGSPCDPNTYSPEYDLMVLTGIAFLSRTGKSNTADETETLREYLNSREELTDTDRRVMMKFLGEEFIFEAWWQAR